MLLKCSEFEGNLLFIILRREIKESRMILHHIFLEPLTFLKYKHTVAIIHDYVMF